MINSEYKSKKPKSNIVTQTVTRSGVFLGLSFKQTKQSDLQKSNYLTSVPNVSFSFDYERVIFDYTDSQNENDKNLIQSIFNDLSPGSNFSISQADFRIDSDATSANLSGFYTFVKLIGNTIIARPANIANINNRITIYSNKHFSSIPQIGINTPPTSNVINYTITNSLLSDKKNLFTSLGVYPGDIVKIIGTTNNDRIFKVLSLINNSDGSETLIVENEVLDEVSFGNSIILELIQSGPYLTEKINFNNIETGSCILVSDFSETCFNNQSEIQCSFRKTQNNAKSYVWSIGQSCEQPVATTATSRIIRSPRLSIKEQLKKLIQEDPSLNDQEFISQEESSIIRTIQ